MIEPITNQAAVEEEDSGTRRGFIAAAGVAGAAYVAALGYPVYRYLASPIEMAASAAAVTEVAPRALPGGAVPLARLDDPQRGDIVVFQIPELNPEPLIKRVVGLPGETVEVRQQRVHINGKPLSDHWGQLTPSLIGGCAGADFGPVKVPAGQYFMLGDNRCNSYDSRLWDGHGGFVPRERILGRARLIFWPGHEAQPGDRWTRLGPPMQ